MWFGILTPGAHPSRPSATPEATVLCWTPGDRRRIDGPFAAVHGGLRVLRRQFHDERLEAAAPRCFVCRMEILVPDVEELGPITELADDGPPVGSPERSATPRPLPPARALLAHVHLAALEGPDDPPLDEEVLLTVAGTPLALLVPLDCVPHTLALMDRVELPEPARCLGCGTVLPGGSAQRAAEEARHARRLRPRRRRGGHGPRVA